jgi:hypothetical protein
VLLAAAPDDESTSAVRVLLKVKSVDGVGSSSKMDNSPAADSAKNPEKKLAGTAIPSRCTWALTVLPVSEVAQNETSTATPQQVWAVLL